MMTSEDGSLLRADVVVIGAGVMGLFTAFHLAQMGVKRVVVLERGPVGGVASPRSAGMLRHHYNHPLPIELALRGREFYSKFHMHTGYEAGFVPNGYLFGLDRDSGDQIERMVGMAQDAGADTTLISAADTRKHFPQIDPAGWHGPVAFDRSAAYVQPHLTICGLVAAVRRLEVQIHEGVAAAGIDVSSGEVSGVWTDRGARISSNVVVNAAGAWAAKVSAMADVTVPITVNRLLQIFEIRPAFQVPTTRPSLSSAALDLYARPNPGNRILIGSRKYFDAPKDPDLIDLTYDADDVQGTQERYRRLVPDAAPARAYRTWAGIDGDTPDFQPVLGEVPDRPGLILAAGGSAHGFKLGPILGRLLAELITTGKAQTVDIQPFSLQRFDNNQLFPRGYKQMGA